MHHPPRTGIRHDARQGILPCGQGRAAPRRRLPPLPDRRTPSRAIARQPDIKQRLAALLAPLDAGQDLHRTLEALFACNLDRERTASKLCIHRRTLRYRMDRIRDLSGIDPDSTHGIQLLRAALTATRLPTLNPQNPLPESGSTDAAAQRGEADY